MRVLMALVLSAGLAQADGEKAGDFDYYVMALSWLAHMVRPGRRPSRFAPV